MVQVDKDEIQALNNGGKAPTPIVPNPDQIIQPPVPPNNEQVVVTQPVLSEEDELLPLLQPMPIVPYHTALLPVPIVPIPLLPMQIRYCLQTINTTGTSIITLTTFLSMVVYEPKSGEFGYQLVIVWISLVIYQNITRLWIIFSFHFKVSKFT